MKALYTLLQRYVEPIETECDHILRASKDDCKHTRELCSLPAMQS